MKYHHKVTIRGAAMRLKNKWPRLSNRLMMLLDDPDLCAHQFRVSEIGDRREDGKTEWACCKCHQVSLVQHPMSAPGEIVFDVFEKIGVKLV
jgi:hypothetical protein